MSAAARLYLCIGGFSTAPVFGLKQQSVSKAGAYECGGRPVQFAEFVQTFGRTYAPGSEEYAMREALFLERAEAGVRHNCEAEASWEVGVNHLSDWTEAELQGLLGHKSSSRRAQAPVIRLNMFRSLRGGLEPAVRAGLVEKPNELTDAINSGTYDYYGLFKRRFAGQSVDPFGSP
mmetsp:Transcript_78674/g.208816  ORF Transcript_78674/g.208816 Transcript_78674/m.208816 type:complete len:176 (+) Transcript_78674:98-625(+)